MDDQERKLVWDNKYDILSRMASVWPFAIPRSHFYQPEAQRVRKIYNLSEALAGDRNTDLQSVEIIEMHKTPTDDGLIQRHITYYH